MSFVYRSGDALEGRDETVLLLMAEGCMNHEIADELELSIETVKEYVKRVIGKLCARNRTHAVALAYHRGLLIPMRDEA